MPINPAIAMGVRGIELADPLAQYGRVAAIQSAQQQNALAQLQMQQAQREEAATNALSQAYQSAYSPETGKIDTNKLRQSLATGGFGAKIPTVEKALGELESQALTRQKLQSELIDTKLKQARSFLDTLDPTDPNAPQQYLAWHQANHSDPVLGPALAARGVTAEQSLGRIQQAIQQGPAAFAQLINQSKLGTEKFIELNKPTFVEAGGVRVPVSGLTGQRLANVPTIEQQPLPAAVEAQKTRIAQAGATVMPAQEKEFEKALGAGQAKRVLDSKTAAEDAAQILQTNQVGRDILKSGAITGAGANFFVGLNNALKQGGVDFGYADAAANSQAYAAAMAQNVGKLIKQYGAGTGLSDADRDFATQAAGGKINLDEKAIRKILDINDRAANFVIDRHNKDVKGIKTNIPLAVEKPVFEQQRPPAAAQIPGQGAAPAAIPQAAIDALKSGRGTDAQFDEIFGPGAAKRVRGGK